MPVVSEPPPTTAKGEATAIWPRARRQGSGKGYLGPLDPVPVRSYKAEYSHSSLNICSSSSQVMTHCCNKAKHLLFRLLQVVLLPQCK